MLRHRRPRLPKTFAADVGPARRAAARAVAAGLSLDGIPQLWRNDGYKAAFDRAQYGKCGYCEVFAKNHPAAMEHHAPKGCVQVLAAEGIELKWSCKVRDRETPEICATGYYWLMFAWTNWLLACERCNTPWKRSLFPVREAPHPLPPHPRRRFTPLLLHPFGPRDPVDHLEFTERGQIAPRRASVYGRATIRTCGLHRESLSGKRAGIAGDTYREIRWLRDALKAPDRVGAWKSTVRLLSLGAEDREHAGMVRSIVLSELGHRWRALQALEAKLRPTAGRGARTRAKR
jgi:hypothetical protein